MGPVVLLGYIEDTPSLLDELILVSGLLGWAMDTGRLVDLTVLASRFSGGANSSRSLGQGIMLIAVIKNIVVPAEKAIVTPITVIIVVVVVDALRERGLGFIRVIGIVNLVLRR